MPDRHSKPCRPSATHIATSGSQSSPAATVSRAPSRSTPRVTIRATVPGHALVGDHDVRAAGEDEVGAAGGLDDLVLGARLDELARRAAEPQRGQAGEFHYDRPGREHVRAQRPAEDLLRRARRVEQRARARRRSRRPSRAASRPGPRSRCCRSRRAGPGSRPARRSSTRSSARPHPAPRARSPGPARACCGSARSARRRRRAPPAPPGRTRAPAPGWPSRWCRRTRSPARPRRSAAARSRTPARAGRGPRRGSRRRPRSRPRSAAPPTRARPSTRSSPVSDSSIERFTLARLCDSVALRKTLTSWKRSRSASALSSPRSLGISTDSETSSGTSIRSQHLGAVGELRDHVRAHEARDLEPLQPRRGERLDQPHLVLGRDDLGLVLEPVPGPDLADGYVHAARV